MPEMVAKFAMGCPYRADMLLKGGYDLSREQTVPGQILSCLVQPSDRPVLARLRHLGR